MSHPRFLSAPSLKSNWISYNAPETRPSTSTVRGLGAPSQRMSCITKLKLFADSSSFPVKACWPAQLSMEFVAVVVTVTPFFSTTPSSVTAAPSPDLSVKNSTPLIVLSILPKTSMAITTVEGSRFRSSGPLKVLTSPVNIVSIVNSGSNGSISIPSLTPSPSESILLGSVPLSFSLTKIPLLVSIPSLRPSLSESVFLGLVPVLLILTYSPVSVSTLSLSPSSSVSTLVGSVLVSSYSSMSEIPSPSKSPVPEPGPGPLAEPFKSSRLSARRSSYVSGNPSSSVSSAAVVAFKMIPCNMGFPSVLT